VGDFNGDGHQDVVVALLGTLQLYTGDGNGSFTRAGSVSATGVGTITAMEVGDFNNDGFLDVVAADDNTIAIFFNDGTGVLTAGPTTAAPFDNRCSGAGTYFRIGVADIDGDGLLDLLFPSNDSVFIVLQGDGQGHFKQSSAVNLPLNTPHISYCGITAGDFNNDGWVDVAYANQPTVAFNDGTGGFSYANTFATNPPLDVGTFMAAGDMNGDGFLDLLGVTLAADIFKNQGNSTFAEAGPFGLSSVFDSDVVLGDLTGAGALDAFTSAFFCTGTSICSPEVSRGFPLIGNGASALYPGSTLSGASLEPSVVRIADFNEDGRLDVVYAGFSDPNVGPNGVAFEYWLQVPGPPIWSVPQQDFGTVILHLGQMSGNQQQLLTETLSNSGPGPLDIVNITSKNPGPPGAPAQTDFPILTAASTCPLNGGTLQPGGSCNVVLSFQPSIFGTFSETLSVVDDANGVPGSVQNVTLTGTAIELDASIQQPINADGTSVFNASRGVVPVKFTLQQNGVPVGKNPGPVGCQLPPATIGIIRTAGGTIGPIDESVFEMSADSGANFRIETTSCQYVYNLDARALGPGSYSVQILVGPLPGEKNPGPGGIGSATFGLR